MQSSALIRTTLLTAALLACTVLAIVVYNTEQDKRALKEDLVELSKVKYGLFSVDEWKRIMADIITKKIESFSFEEGSQEVMQEKIETFLYKVIDDFEGRYHKENSNSFEGFFRSVGAKAFNVFGQMKKDVPTFSRQIMEFIDSMENREALVGFIIDKLHDYTDNTFSEIDYTLHDSIIAKHGATDRAVTVELLRNDIEALTAAKQGWQWAFFAIILLLMGYALMEKHFTKEDYLLLTLTSFTLLLSGLLLPMIDIDARISKMEFTLLGESVAFQDQVLYFKSKSIMEVVWLMMGQAKLDTFLVGFLVLTFSVLFPLSKLVASVLFLFSEAMESNRIIRFLVFKTGKWSMADVMVIAILMSYIGFTGIISEQLSQVENMGRQMDILTTNESNLQVGFYLFTSFVVLSLLIAHKLQFGNKPAEEAKPFEMTTN